MKRRQQERTNAKVQDCFNYLDSILSFEENGNKEDTTMEKMKNCMSKYYSSKTNAVGNIFTTKSGIAAMAHGLVGKGWDRQVLFRYWLLSAVD